jgi:beta-mannosidase
MKCRPAGNPGRIAKPSVNARTLALPDPGLDAQLTVSGHGIVLTVQAKYLARAVWVDFGALDARLSDNAFDLLPGARVEIRVDGAADIESLRQALEVRSLFNATQKSP